MANKYWIVGTGSTGNWNDTANWSASSGGAGGEAVPTASDVAIFDENGIGGCTLDVNVSVGELRVKAGYTGATTDGILDCSTFNIVTSASGGSGDFVFYGRRVDLQAGSHSVAGNFNLEPTESSANTCTVTMTNSVDDVELYARMGFQDLVIDGAITMNHDTVVETLTIENRGTLSISATIKLKVTDTVTVNKKGLLTGSGTLQVEAGVHVHNSGDIDVAYVVAKNANVFGINGTFDCIEFKFLADAGSPFVIVTYPFYVKGNLVLEPDGGFLQFVALGNLTVEGDFSLRMTNGNMQLTTFAGNTFTMGGSFTIVDNGFTLSGTGGGIISMKPFDNLNVRTIDIAAAPSVDEIIIEDGPHDVIRQFTSNAVMNALTVKSGQIDFNGKSITTLSSMSILDDVQILNPLLAGTVLRSEYESVYITYEGGDELQRHNLEAEDTMYIQAPVGNIVLRGANVKNVDCSSLPTGVIANCTGSVDLGNNVNCQFGGTSADTDASVNILVEDDTTEEPAQFDVYAIRRSNEIYDDINNNYLVTCQVACESACQEACETVCQTDCEAVCQAGCEAACQGSCQDSCEDTCESGCQSGCESDCQLACEIDCQTGCQYPCELSCQSGCQEACETACQSGCQETCEFECQSSFEQGCGDACELSCQSGVESSCQTTCELTCQVATQDACGTACENACQVTCETDCQAACETGCQSACELLCQSGCQTSCELLCQSGCEVGCEEACERACQSAAEQTVISPVRAHQDYINKLKGKLRRKGVDTRGMR